MRVLVTGGAGYIGSIMTPMLLEAGHDVLVVDDFSTGHREALADTDLAEVDLLDSPALAATCSRFAPEAAMHFASRILAGESVKDPMKYFRDNVGGVVNLLSAVIDSGCSMFVLSSTAAVYGAPDEVPITEGAAKAPVNPYGWTKLMAEKMLCELARAGSLRSVALRYFNAAGADTERGLGEDHRPESHLIPNVIAAALGKTEAVRVFGTDYPTPDGTCVRDYIHVLDLCRAHLSALEYLEGGGKSAAFNLGNGSGFSVREVVEAVRRVSGRDFKVVEDPRREGDPPVLVASSLKAAEALGWRPAIPELDRIVDSAWRWHREHPDGY